MVAITIVRKYDIVITISIDKAKFEVMEFVEKVEDRFDISIPLNILPDVKTLGDFARKLHELDV